ncbi:MAG: hypothetical protein LBP53_00120 [Candidatus Peribacteria bacterium]|jgi:hypothetical protein|nr:hypothetical protein [Candidatus Peribacteria bacterium]
MNGKEEPDCLETTLNLSVQRQEEIRQRFEGKICELLTKLKNIARKDDNKTNQNSIIFCNK